MSPTLDPPGSGGSPERQAAASEGGFRYAAVWLLVALGVLFVTAPFVEDLPQGNLIEVLQLTLVMVSAVLAIGGRRRFLVVALLLLVLALAGKWISHFRPDLLHAVVFFATSLMFFAFVIAQLIVFIIRAPRVDANVLCAGVSGYLILGLLWMPAYLVVARVNPGAFTVPAAPGAPAVLDSFSAFYFSLITLSTVGYGDIVPVSKVARMLAATESITGLLYMAVLISRLVSVYSSARPAAKGNLLI